jgi:signal transduction histidine kinase
MANDKRRSRRDLAADVAYVALAAASGMLFLIIKPGVNGPGLVHGHSELAFAVDAGIGMAMSAALCLRRRWPAGIALAALIPFVVSLSAGGAAFLALFNVSIRRRTGVGPAIGGLYLVAFVGYYLLWYRQYPFWAAWLLMLTEVAAVVALGMYVRARRQLVASLRQRAEQAEAAQQLLAQQARHAERTRIAQEMHDVLGHRVSLMALHAGALEVRPDLPPAEVAEAAGLIRSTARQALEDLRGIVGVLQDGDGDAGDEAPRAPQPSLLDISGLVEESCRAGMNVALDMRVEAPEAAPGTLGRDAYRIVREGLTNVSKHARGTATTVSLAGSPGQGLEITIRNRLPIEPAADPPLPGGGMGLTGLTERVALSGGTLSHGPSSDGTFVVSAALRWQR